MKKIKFGVISILSFLASFIILFLVTPNVKYYITNFMIGVSCFCCCISFVASILAFIKNKVFQIILGAISIPFTLILLLFCYVAFEENYLKLNRYDTENYFFEKNKRVYYSLGEGYFDYWFENGVLNYNTIMGGDGGPGPYYDYLFPNKHEPLLNLEKFLDYYGYEYSIDEKKQKTIIHLDDEDINLYWGARTVSYSESGKKIELNSPIIHRNCHDAYSWTSDSRLYTFISVSFLNEAGFLKNGQSKEVSRAKNKKVSDNNVFDEIKNGNLNAVQQLVNEGFDIYHAQLIFAENFTMHCSTEIKELSHCS